MNSRGQETFEALYKVFEHIKPNDVLGLVVKALVKAKDFGHEAAGLVLLRADRMLLERGIGYPRDGLIVPYEPGWTAAMLIDAERLYEAIAGPFTESEVDAAVVVTTQALNRVLRDDERSAIEAQASPPL